MTKLSKYLLLYFFIGISFSSVFGQNKSTIPILTADSLASGNYKNILTSFFQAAATDLTGPSKGFEFKSNIFAIMLKNNPRLNIDTNYLKYQACRNINLDLGIKDSNNQFSNVNVGVTYALVNKRDATTKSFVKGVMQDTAANKMFRLNSNILNAIDFNKSFNQPKKDSLRREYSKFARDTSNIKLSSLSQELQAIIKDSYKHTYGVVLNNPNYSCHKTVQSIYDSIKNYYQNRGLWTVGANFNKFTDPHQLSGVSFSTQYIKGIINPNAATNIEITADASYNFSDDSTNTDANLKRQTFTGEAGLNWVIKGWGNQQSAFELKITAADNAVTTAPYKGEQKNVFTLNGTLNIRISNDINIPIQIKYDPKSGNVFGFLNITSNFTMLGSLFK